VQQCQRQALRNLATEYSSDFNMGNSDDADGVDAAEPQRKAVWTVEIVVIAFLAIGPGLLLTVAMVMRVPLVVDFASFWGRSCACMTTLLN
jgi:hypothetical protein